MFLDSVVHGKAIPLRPRACLRRPTMSIAHRIAVTLLLATIAACGGRKQPVSAPDIATTRSALFTNGDFEGDSDGSPPSGWTVEPYANNGLGSASPTSWSQLNLQAGGTSRTYVRVGSTETVVPAGLSNAVTLRVPKYGTHAAVVNEGGSGQNVNALRQTMTTTNADVDPADNKVHVRFAIAPVLQNPDGHGPTDQPYFWVQLENKTKNAILFYTFNYSNQPGVPWKEDPNPAGGERVLYTDWQAFDISPGPAQLAVGDQVEIVVLAAGCAWGGHYGEVYVDAFGPSLPGLGVTATAPQQVNTGSTMTYTFSYSNGGAAAATNATIVENLPTGTTFQSYSAPGASCTAPSVGGTGAVTCNVGTVNPAASGSFTVTVNVTAGSGSTVSNGDYNISSAGVSALIGPLVTTSVTSGVTYADLAVTKTDGVAAVGWGDTTTYTMVVTNHGPAAADGATLSDPLPANMASMDWTCAAGNGAACPAASGSGAISETIATFPSDGVLTYTVTGHVASGSGSGSLVNQATVSAPGGVTDNDSTNNVAVDTDQIGTLRTLTLQKAGTGQGTVVSSPAAISCGGACPSQSASFLDSTSVVLTATASSGYVFNGWSGGGCTGAQATCAVSLTADTPVTATFAPIQWTVTGSAPGGNGTISCESPVDNGTSSTCTLTPGARSFLSGLTDNGSNVLGAVSGSTYAINNVTGNHTVVATFTASASSTALGASPESSVYGQSVTFTATVAGVTPTGTPGGNVTFNDNGSAIPACSDLALSGGTASCTVGDLAVGTHPITAVSSGDATWNGSTSAVNNYVVSKASTTLALSDSPASSSLNGVAVTLTATVSTTAPGSGTAAGSVAFTDNGSGITGCGAVALSGGVATCTTQAALGAGGHTFAATYGGSASYNGSSGSLSHTVLRVIPAVTLVSDVSPSLFGQPVTFTVSLSHALGTPTGQVTLMDGATVVCGPLNLSGGAASCSSSALTVGTHSLVAQYGGDSGFLPTNSAALSQLVVRSTTTTSVAGDMSQSVYGQTVTFTATVDPDAPAAVTPTGTVTFRDSATVICADVPLSGGQATCQASTLAVNWHALSARYNGSTGYAPSTSFSATLQVNQAATSVALTPAPASSVVGQSVALSVLVSPTAPGAGTPTGTVTVSDGGVPLAGCTSLALSSAAASCTVSDLPVGVHTLSVSYGGETRFLASSSGSQSFTVNQASTSVVVAPTAATVHGQSVTFTASVAATAPGAGTPTGTITFRDGGSAIGTGSVSGGQATFTTSALAVDSHTITAIYGGDASFLTSTSAPSTHTVNRAATSTSLAASPASPVFGQMVTLTATVTPTAPGAGTPTGAVTFLDSGSPIAGCEGVALSGATATCTTAALAAGAHPLGALYSGDVSFLGSSAAGQSYTVHPAATVVALSAGPNPSVFGEAVSLQVTATAQAPSGAVPAGTVELLDGATVIASAALDGAGQHTFTVSSLAAGTHSLTAALQASAAFQASSSPAVQQVVVRADTTTSLVSSLPTSTYGDSVTFTATVAAVAPGAGTPDGTVVFSDGSTVLGTGSLGGGQATFTTSSLHAGVHTLTAEYQGNAGFNGSTSGPTTQAVARASSQVLLAAAPNPSVNGQPVIFAATVSSPAETPTGSVTFTTGSLTLGSATLDGSGQGSASYSALPVATHPVVAHYAGADDWLPSDSAPLSQVVQRAAVAMVLAAGPQPTVFGQPLTLTATLTVQAPGAGTPTGTVTFRDGATIFGTATVQPDGTAVLVIGSLAAGSHTLSASYEGDAGFAAASNTLDVQHTVDQAAVAVALTPTVNPSRSGEDVTFTVTVSAAAPGSGTPSGTVTVDDGGSPLATVTLSAGSGTFNTAALAVGTHPLSATYAGDGSFLTGSASLSQEVQRSEAALGLVSSATPSRFGQSVAFTATVSAVAPGTGTPTGAVTFRDGATTLGTATIDGSGVASLSSSSLAVGGHTITAQFGGDSSFNASSGTIAQTVQAANTTLTLAAAPSPATYGQAVVLTATVAAQSPGAGTPTGSVTFRDGSTVLGSGSLAGGVATVSAPGLTAGTHALTAQYSGAYSYLASSGAASLTVGQGSTTVAVASSRNPSRAGRPVTFTATLTSPHATPTGTVTFKDGTTVLGTATLSDGTGSIVVRTLTKGDHAITVEYGGVADFAGSTGTLAGGQTVENTPPVAGSGTALALGTAHATSASGDASHGELDGARTAEVWARAGWTAAEEVESHPTLIRLGGTAGDRFALGIAPDRQSLTVTIGGSTTDVPVALADGGWHHLALVSGEDHTSVVVDGTAVGEIAGAFAAVEAEALTLGEGFAGELDELRLWSSARSLDELAADARRPLQGSETGLLGLWRLDEGAGTELFDAGPGHVELSAELPDDVSATDAAFAASGAWRAREVWQERSLAPIDAGYDADGDELTLTLATAPAHGTATADADHLQVNYRPEDGYLGSDQLTFALSDGSAQSSYAVDITVQRILVCSTSSDCGGGDLCVENHCTAPADITVRSGGCGTGGGASLLALLGVLLALRLTVRRRPLPLSLAVVAVLLAGLGGAAGAQVPEGFALQTFEPAPAGDHFFTVPGASVDGHLRPAAGLVLSWARDPLVIKVGGQPIPDGKIVRSQLWGEALGSLALGDWVLLDVAAPVALAQAGDQPLPDLAPVTSTGFGDLRLGARTALGAAGPVNFAAGLNLWVPTGAQGAFASDGRFRGALQMIAGGEIAALSAEWGAQVGLLARSARDLVITRTGTALAFSAGAAWRWSDLRIGPELYGRYQFEGTATSPLEALLGGSWALRQVDLGLALGTAFNDAPGAAPLRVLARVTWRPEVSRPAQVTAEPVPEAKASPAVEPSVNAAPALRSPPPAPQPDRDDDGVADAEDACPEQPGARSDAPSLNGCPELAVVTRQKIEILQQIRFESSSDRIRAESEPVLRAVAALLAAHPEIADLRIEGHTDDRGAARSNRLLSEKRAAAVKAWLVSRGRVDALRLEARGHGASRPIASNETPDGRRRNRRVEFLVVPGAATRAR